MTFKNYYTVLGLKDFASVREIKAAYRKLAFRYHPDHNKAGTSGHERFMEIKEAYEFLASPEKRNQLDHFLKKKQFYAPSYGFSQYVPHNVFAGEPTEKTEKPVPQKPLWLILLKPLVLILITIAFMYLIMRPPAWLTGLFGGK